MARKPQPQQTLVEQWIDHAPIEVFEQLDRGVAWEADVDDDNGWLRLYPGHEGCGECEGRTQWCSMDVYCEHAEEYTLDELPMNVLDGVILMLQTFGRCEFSDLEEHREAVAKQAVADRKARQKAEKQSQMAMVL